MFLSLSCVACLCHHLVRGVVCVILVQQFGFRHFVMVFSYMWMIRITKHIRSDKNIDTKLNNSR